MRKSRKLGRAIKRVQPAVSAIALAAMSATASGTTWIYEPFNYAVSPPPPPVPLQGQTNTSTGTSANGLTWLQAGGGVNAVQIPAGINVTSGNLSGPTELVPSVGNDL